MSVTAVLRGAGVAVAVFTGIAADIPTAHTDFFPSIRTAEAAERLPMYTVRYTGDEPADTLLISNDRGYMYRVLPQGYAVAYPIARGEDEFAIPAGTSLKVVFMDRNPSWTPTPSQRAMNPRLRNVGTVPPGPNNPLGRFSMGLAYANGKATFWRIHSTPDESSIGYAASNGCIRMYEVHIKHFFDGATLSNGWKLKPIERQINVKVFKREVPGIEDRGPRRSARLPTQKM